MRIVPFTRTTVTTSLALIATGAVLIAQRQPVTPMVPMVDGTCPPGTTEVRPGRCRAPAHYRNALRVTPGLPKAGWPQ